MTLDEVKPGIGQGLLDGYGNLSAAQLRRMACDATVVRVVLGSKSEILDIGRASGAVPRPIRRALILWDKGCSPRIAPRKPMGVNLTLLSSGGSAARRRSTP